MCAVRCSLTVALIESAAASFVDHTIVSYDPVAKEYEVILKDGAMRSCDWRNACIAGARSMHRRGSGRHQYYTQAVQDAVESLQQSRGSMTMAHVHAQLGAIRALTADPL